MIEDDEKEAHPRVSNINLKYGLLENFYDVSNLYGMFSPDFKLFEIFKISKSIDKSSKTSRSVNYTNTSQVSVNFCNIFGIFK